jgi:ATP-dependent Lhr-like helicase
MLQTYAALDLLERGEMDATEMIETPYQCLAQQVMAILFPKGQLAADAIAAPEQIFPVWSAIPDADLALLIDYMIEQEFIEIMDDEAIVGLEGERLLRSRDFLRTVFHDQ